MSTRLLNRTVHTSAKEKRKPVSDFAYVICRVLSSDMGVFTQAFPVGELGIVKELTRADVKEFLEDVPESDEEAFLDKHTVSTVDYHGDDYYVIGSVTEVLRAMDIASKTRTAIPVGGD
jgi:hypothetical protein